MPDAIAAAFTNLPRPPRPTRARTQLESFLVLRRNPLELWGEVAYEADILPGKFLGRPQLMVNAPEAIRHVLVTNAENYRRNIGTVRVLQPVLGSGLFLAEGAAWRHQRRTIAPAFTPRTMPVLAGHVLAACAEAEERLAAQAGRGVELLPQLQRLALAIAAQSMFSLEMSRFGAELRTLLVEYATKFARPGMFDLLLPEGMPSPLDVGRAAFRARWLRMIDRLIDARAAQAAPPDAPRDLFDMLAAARDPETGAAFDRAQLRDEVSTMILAGHETTAVTLFWACFIAARMPGQQARLAAEAAAGVHAAMPAMRAHLDETLRLYPPAFLIVREARGTDEIGGHRIAPGTVVSISPWVVHRHRRLWRDPEVFDPSRFAAGAPPVERFAYIPFGAGPRICVGMQFALTEATLVLGRLLARFRLDVVGGRGVVPRAFVTTQPDRPVRFLLTPRTAARGTARGGWPTGGVPAVSGDMPDASGV
jgi:unspecific monooxygenase